MHVSAVILLKHRVLSLRGASFLTLEPTQRCVYQVHCMCECVYSICQAAAVTRQRCYQVGSNTVFQHLKQQHGDLFQRARASE